MLQFQNLMRTAAVERFTSPYEHFIIDDFLDTELALQLSSEFVEFESSYWYDYNNPLENKKSCNNWFAFPATTYQFFSYLNSPEFVAHLSNLTRVELRPDHGLHGGGWHIHGNNGKLNVHLDYSIHPKLHLQRNYNLILYLSPEWDPSWGGSLELWSHNKETNLPNECVKTVECKFNRAIIFNTTQHSWHGFPQPINCPPGAFRKSIASYYLSNPNDATDPRQRVLYAPTEDQKNNPTIETLITQRARW